MSHAEALHTLHPAAGATDAIVEFVSDLRFAALDDEFRQGSVHPGCVVVPAVLALGYDRRISGAALIEAIVAGYEAEIAIGRACHPDLRQRGFHPAAACGVFGAV